VDNFVHTLTKLSTLSSQYEYCSRRLFTLLLTCTVHVYCLPCSSSVDNFVHTLFKLSTLFCEEFTVHIKYCLRISQKVWTKLSTLCSNCPHFYQKEFTVHIKYCLRISQKVWTKLSTLLSNCPHFLGMNFTVHVTV
jgi:hypothetical protein